MVAGSRESLFGSARRAGEVVSAPSERGDEVEIDVTNIEGGVPAVFDVEVEIGGIWHLLHRHTAYDGVCNVVVGVARARQATRQRLRKTGGTATFSASVTRKEQPGKEGGTRA